MIDCSCGLYNVCRIIYDGIPCVCAYGVVSKCMSSNTLYIVQTMYSPFFLLFVVLILGLCCCCWSKKQVDYTKFRSFPSESRISFTENKP